MKKLLLTIGTLSTATAPAILAVACTAALDDEIQKQWDITMSDIYAWQDFKTVASYNDMDELKIRYVKSELLERGREYIFGGPTQIIDDKFYADPSISDVIEYWEGEEITGELILENYNNQVSNMKDLSTLLSGYIGSISLDAPILDDLQSIIDSLELNTNSTKDKLSIINEKMSPYVIGYITEDHKTVYDASMQLPWSASIWALKDSYLFTDTKDADENISAIFDVALNLAFPALIESSKLVEAHAIYTTV